MPRIRDRIGNLLLGRRDAESGERQGGVAGLFRDADGDFRDPISAFGDRTGRRVVSWLGRRFGDDLPDPVGMDNPRQLPPIERISRPVMTNAGMPGPVAIPNPRDETVGRNDGGVSVEPRREMTEAERQQQREQFDRYRNDPNSIYYQGSNFDRMRTPDQIVGPNAHTFNSPTRGLYDSMDVRTGSGQGFNDAVAYYRSIQKPNPNITR